MRLIILSGILLLLTACGQQGSEVNTDLRTAESRQAVKEFFTLLKGELQAAMKSGGPVKAIEVCQVKAPQIAIEISGNKGWRVARTSLKTRNPANKADAWEQQVLQRFETQKQQGVDVTQLEYTELVNNGNTTTFRYMKAIPAGEVCMHCHGSSLSPEVSEKLQQLYPDDQATGYKPGDIRGAFTISQDIR